MIISNAFALGTYILKEDLHLATPPPHPSEAPIINPNPLSTDPQPASAGTKVTLMSLEPRSPPAAFAKGPTASVFAPDASAGAGDGSYDGRSSGDAIKSSEDSHNGTISDITRPSESAPAFGEGNTLLAAAPLKDATKRRKPKNNVTKSNSSFISRVIINDNLSRRMAERPADGLYGFANINRAFQWLDMSSPTKVSTHTCHLQGVLFLTYVTERLLYQDLVHQGPLFMPRCQLGNKGHYSYGCYFGVLYR